MRSFPFYLDQDEIDELAQLLYTHQTIVDTVSSDRPTSDQAYRILCNLRGQCCMRSNGKDPYPDLPMPSGKDFWSPERRRRG